MGCFQVQHSDGDKLKRRKRRRLLWWSFIAKDSSRLSSSAGSSASSGEIEYQKLQDLRQFTLVELKAATKNFTGEKLGEGGFGSVYRGQIKSKKADERIDVAVKRLNVKGQQGQKEWLNEVTYLRMVEHPNLVKLLGYCMDHDDRGPQCLLVYELMPNKGLDDHIFQSRRRTVLSWKRRLHIALGTARGLAYLHEKMKPPILYRDLKSANILLDNEFSPKLSDFGLARDGPSIGNTHVTTAPVGTPGYAAPEYIQTGHLNTKSDVWSFGMVLLELLTGRKALDMNRPRSERSLAEWVKPYSSGDIKKLRKILDPRIKYAGAVPLDEVKAVLGLSQKCIARNPKQRPKMSEVVRQLEAIIAAGSEPPKDKVVEVPESKSQSIASSPEVSEDFSGFSLAEATTSAENSRYLDSGVVQTFEDGDEISKRTALHSGDPGEDGSRTDAETSGPSCETSKDGVTGLDEGDIKEDFEEENQDLPETGKKEEILAPEVRPVLSQDAGDEGDGKEEERQPDPEAVEKEAEILPLPLSHGNEVSGTHISDETTLSMREVPEDVERLPAAKLGKEFARREVDESDARTSAPELKAAETEVSTKGQASREDEGDRPSSCDIPEDVKSEDEMNQQISLNPALIVGQGSAADRHDNASVH